MSPMAEIKCSSCKTPVTNTSGTVSFDCPSCGNQELIRCKHCREVGVRYKCPECEFEGPN